MVEGTTSERTSKVMLAAGYLSLSVGTLAAFRAPARGYELSIYAATPEAYWLAVAVALAVSLAVAFGERGPSLVRDGALLLGAATVLSLVGLPLVRGYRHFGNGDALTHLGWTRDILAGRLEPVDMLYPGIHTMTIFVSNVVGTTPSEAQLFVTLAFAVVFVAFVTLCVRTLGTDRWAAPVGLFSALLLLPVNNVSVHLMAHPITQSLLFLPVVIYLLVKYVGRTGEAANGFRFATPMGTLLALSAVALIFVHPQGALNVVAILVTVTAVQLFYRRFRDNGAINGHRPVYVPTLVAIVAFGAWAPRHDRVRRTVRTISDALLTGSIPADEISQRSASLSELGGSIAGLFTKLFLVSAVFCALTAGVVAVWYAGRLDDRYGQRNAIVTYLIVALVPLSAAFLVFFVASMTTQHFRYVGFVMVPVTILGAIALSEGAETLRSRIPGRAVGVGLVACFLLLAPLPLATAHASPFVYQPNAQVSDHHLQGADATFETMDRDVAFAGIRGGPDRFLDATHGTEGGQRLEIEGLGPGSYIPGAVFGTNLSTHYDEPRYVPVTEADYQREVVLYDGFRYSERGFDRLETSSGIDRVQSNGEYRLYLVGNQTTA